MWNPENDPVIDLKYSRPTVLPHINTSPTMVAAEEGHMAGLFRPNSGGSPRGGGGPQSFELLSSEPVVSQEKTSSWPGNFTERRLTDELSIQSDLRPTAQSFEGMKYQLLSSHSADMHDQTARSGSLSFSPVPDKYDRAMNASNVVISSSRPRLAVPRGAGADRDMYGRPRDHSVDIHLSSRKDEIEHASPHKMKLDRKIIAEETLAVLGTGRYCVSGSREEVDIRDRIQMSIDGTACYGPNDIIIPKQMAPKGTVMIVELVDETTLTCCRRVWYETGVRVGCLVYASGKSPGGGFLAGSGGQEESIARSSAYYHCAMKSSSMYEANRKNKDPFYSDHVVVCTDVPVIRGEHPPHQLVQPWPLSIIAAPAVNAGIVRERLGTVADELIHSRMQVSNPASGSFTPMTHMS